MNATDTAERRVDAEITVANSRDRRPLILVVIALCALVLGALAGYSLGSDGTADERAYVAGGGEPTDRQGEMLDMVDAFVAAMDANDDGAILAMFQGNGEWTRFSKVYRASDGILEEFVRAHGSEQLDLLEPIVVDEYRVVFFDDVRGQANVNVIEFSQVGDLKIAKYRLGN